MRNFTCSARFGHWSCMWITPRFGENPPSYWPPRACHIETEDFSLGERRHFAGLWGAEPLSLRAHSTRGVASSQALFRGVPLEDICVATGQPVLSAHLCQVLRPWHWYGSRFSDLVCLNRPYVVGSLLDQIGSVFSLACLVYRSQSVKHA